MNLREYLTMNSLEAGSINDPKLESAFLDLLIKSGVDNPSSFFGEFVGPTRIIRRTLELYHKLTEAEKRNLVFEGPGVSDNMRLFQSGFALRAFPGRKEVYEELRARWILHYRSIKDEDDNNKTKWISRNLITDTFTGDLFDAERGFRKFAKKYSELDENNRYRVLGLLGDLTILGEHPNYLFGYVSDIDIPKRIEINDVLRFANKRIPHSLDELEDQSQWGEIGFNEDQLFIYNNRERLSKVHKNIADENLDSWRSHLADAIDSGICRNFFDLDGKQLDLLYRAEAFVNKLGRSSKPGLEASNAYYQGFLISLKEGTIAPWANTIIEHFKRGAIGGGSYRILSGGAA